MLIFPWICLFKIESGPNLKFYENISTLVFIYIYKLTKEYGNTFERHDVTLNYIIVLTMIGSILFQNECVI